MSQAIVASTPKSKSCCIEMGEATDGDGAKAGRGVETTPEL